MSFNKVILVGNLGRDPELRYTPQGTAVCNFSMATTEKRKNQEDVTTWFKVTLWGARGETAAKYLTKGSPVYIEGRLQVQEWEDREGNNRYTLEVTATDMQFIGGGQRAEDPAEVEYHEAEAEEEVEDAPKVASTQKAKAKAATATTGKSKKTSKAATKAKPSDDIPF